MKKIDEVTRFIFGDIRTKSDEIIKKMIKLSRFEQKMIIGAYFANLENYIEFEQNVNQIIINNDQKRLVALTTFLSLEMEQVEKRTGFLLVDKQIDSYLVNRYKNKAILENTLKSEVEQVLRKRREVAAQKIVARKKQMDAIKYPPKLASKEVANAFSYKRDSHILVNDLTTQKTNESMIDLTDIVDPNKEKSYYWSSTLDSITCKHCQSLHMKRFTRSELLKFGFNEKNLSVSAHHNCRCHVISELILKGREKIGRTKGKEGEVFTSNMYFNGEMTFKEYQEYLETGIYEPF